ncbi:hypothetical protein GOP47_0000339 [Adiantum capillus-veneris]|uniref:Uncharacterized protein n=1 Tax=Adiantum capillus-veneris TaxID=13818 RepID=A0A9D4VDS0_ADICA|nr:hypothetical protein GOP47_0000339 [Adiantum capillus-veneris]
MAFISRENLSMVLNNEWNNDGKEVPSSILPTESLLDKVMLTIEELATAIRPMAPQKGSPQENSNKIGGDGNADIRGLLVESMEDDTMPLGNKEDNHTMSADNDNTSEQQTPPTMVVGPVTCQQKEAHEGSSESDAHG